VIRDIDEHLARIERELAEHERLKGERRRLLAARAALTGARQQGRARVSRQHVAEYLREHPGSLPAAIAAALGVPVTNVSAHLYRGKDRCFVRRQDGWHVK
jgi:DNA-directed RNA polymerase specialized sigma24 family protein